MCNRYDQVGSSDKDFNCVREVSRLNLMWVTDYPHCFLSILLVYPEKLRCSSQVTSGPLPSTYSLILHYLTLYTLGYRKRH